MGLGSGESPRPALGGITETTGGVWWIAEFFLAGNGTNAACDQISEAGAEPGTLGPETRNVYGFP